MSKILIIAEKPSVAREIASTLGGFTKHDGFMESATAVVSSGIGHLVELYVPSAATTGKDLASLPVIPERFDLQPIAKTKAQFALLSKLMKRADIREIVNACDAGREGELIFRLIYEMAGCKKPTKRMWLQSMTSGAIQDAFKGMKPGSEYDALSDAAKCRSEADWLVGINGSRGITSLKQHQTGTYQQMTAGRVQTPTLAILVDRENEIKSFVPKDFWEIHGTFQCAAGTFLGKWFSATTVATEESGFLAGRFQKRSDADAILLKCRGANPTSVKDESKTVVTPPPRLFDLTTLQREANKLYRMSAKATLDVAQSLYETHKATSYPRTDSSALPEDYVEQAKQVASALCGREFSPHADNVVANGWIKPDKRVFDNSKISDHFAIIPTGNKPSGLSEMEAKIYDLIVRRFIAVFHPAAEYNLTTRITTVATETFKSTGKVLVREGWLAVYGKHADYNGDPSQTLPAVSSAERTTTLAMDLKTLQTQPPSRYTEGTLLAAMESPGKFVDDDEARSALKERGLGTPATRAAIIEGLLSAKDGAGKAKEPYVRREGKVQHLVPSEKGMSLIEFLETNGVHALVSPQMTGEWENKLRLIETGRFTRKAFMAEIATMTRSFISTIREKAGTMASQDQDALDATCPKCGAEMLSGDRTLDCKSACGFKLWREVCKRRLTDDEAVALIRDGATAELNGFTSVKSGKQFAARLKLNRDTWRADFDFGQQGGDAPGGTLGATLSAPCPRCNSSVRDTGKTYACEKGDFKLWKVIAQRELSENEANTLIGTGAHPVLDGFVSSKGNSFSAALELSTDFNKVNFNFEGLR